MTAFLVSTTFLVAATAGAAKGFEPGDLRICNAKRCIPIMNRPALTALGAFYYIGTRPPSVAPRAPLGAPSFELRFDNGYVTGIVATPQARPLPELRGQHSAGSTLDAGTGSTRKAARELRRLTVRASGPFRLTRAALARSR